MNAGADDRFTSAACGQHLQGNTISCGSQAVFLSLEVKVSPLSFLVADADTVRNGKS